MQKVGKKYISDFFEYKLDFLQIFSFAVRQQPHTEKSLLRKESVEHTDHLSGKDQSIKFDLMFWIKFSLSLIQMEDQ